jgi:hypothetical protein
MAHIRQNYFCEEGKYISGGFRNVWKRLLEADPNGADSTNEPPYRRERMFRKLLIIR